MSQRWDQLEERLADYESQLDSVYRLYHIPVLATLMAFMLWIRVRNYERHIGPDGEPLFRGNDPYYHYRSTNYVIENYPFTMPFDPWTSFDTGTRVGMFGTLFDQVVATVALVVGFGSPSQSTVVMTALMTTPVIAVLCVVPLYYVGSRLGGRFGGIIAVVVLALTPGAFLTRSVAGFFDHHVAEALGTLFVLAATMAMLAVAQRERPIYEFIETRDFDALRRPVLWALPLAVALVATILVWPPAVFLFAIFGVFLFLQLSVEFVRGHSPDHVAIPVVVAMVLVALLLIPFTKTLELTATDYSILQPLLALAVAAGATFMAGVARLWEPTDLPRAGYPAGILGVGVAGVAVLAVAAPEAFDFFLSQAERVGGLGSTDTAATVGEAQAVSNPGQFFFRNYGLAFYTAIAGLLLMSYRAVAEERPRAEYLLVVVFSAFMILFTLTQRRFDYYLVIGVAAANAYLVGWVYGFVDLEEVRRDVRNIKPYQILVVVAILFVVAGPLVVTGATVAQADRASQPGEMQQWGESLDWMAGETPEPGAYGGGSDPRLEYYGTYENTDDFAYEDGEYGVLAWWDYGHYITTRGERIPVANPFQQHATESADFLLADEEGEALEALEEDSGEAEGVRYVMVDYQLGYAGTRKYNAPTAFESRHDVDGGDVGVTVFGNRGGNPRRLYGVHTQRGYESMRVRLYQFHGSARDPATFVTRFEQYAPEDGFAAVPQDGRPIEAYNTTEAARTAAEEDPNAIHGGVLGAPSERVRALQHFRLVHASEFGAPSPFRRITGQTGSQEPWVKTFERVEGATVRGSGPPDTEVQAQVVMEVPTTGEEFVYRQYAQTDADGDFEMVVPYSTTGYDEWGTEEGYTDVDVRANGSYQFLAFETDENGTAGLPWTGSADVTEGQVLGEDDSAVEVELREGTVGGGDADGADADGNSDSDSDSDSDSGSGAGGDDDGSDGQQRVGTHRP